MGKLKALKIFLRTGWCLWMRQGLLLAMFHRESYRSLFTQGFGSLWKKLIQPFATLLSQSVTTPTAQYQLWLKQQQHATSDERSVWSGIATIGDRPVISIIAAPFRLQVEPSGWCFESIMAQDYPHWELIVACDSSRHSAVEILAEKYCTTDGRISIVENGARLRVAASLNKALELVRGDFVALVDVDDELSPHALRENILAIKNFPHVDMIYSDEDMIDRQGTRHSPFFKPDWSPDTHLSHPYAQHLGVYRTDLVRKAGGFRQGLDGCPEYDLTLRLTERTGHIRHIPKLLYHSRMSPDIAAVESAASPGAVQQCALRAVQEALERRGEGGWVEPVHHGFLRYRVHYPLNGNPLISIIIPTRDLAGTLGKCLRSIFSRSTYPNYEVIVIDNGSTKNNTLSLFSEWTRREPRRFRVHRADIPFNYPRLNNAALRDARGQLLLFLNNDTEVITPDWLEEMAGHAMRRSTGAVGAKLLYPDHTIQHAGIFLGFGGVAGHIHRCSYRDSPGYFGRLLANYNCSAVTGACMMVRRVLFEAAGGFDEKLAVTLNDVDLCIKLLARGCYNIMLPHVELYHHESRSRGFDFTATKQERFQREIDLVLERWPQYFAHDPFYNPNLTRDREDFSIRI
jgi:O-antigen biosynthesis protein